nr:DUF5689 domain-containing protein [uncultured Carboxylicivirga sp.]
MKKLNSKLLFITLLTTVLTWSCDMNNEDAPPYIEFVPAPNVSSVTHIKSLYDQEMEKYYRDRVPVEITEDICLKGIISADDKTSNGNLYKEAYLQDETGGIKLVFVSTGGIYANDSVVINMKGLYIGDYGDFIQIGGIPYTDTNGNLRVSGIDKYDCLKRTKIDGQELQPLLISIDQIGEEHMGMLIELQDVQFRDDEIGKTYATPETDDQEASTENRIMTDCNGNEITVRSSGYSSFAGDLLPQGKGSIVGILTKYTSTYQLVIRNIDEVQLDGNRCGDDNDVTPTPIDIALGSAVESIIEDFGTQTSNNDITIDGWNNFATVGTRTWRCKTYNDEVYAQATGFSSGEAAIESWLLLPPVSNSGSKTISFQTEYAYWAHADGNTPLKLVYSTDFTGGDPTIASWTELNATFATNGVDLQNTWVNSGSINLPDSNNPLVIAFVYTGSDTEKTSMRIDNIIIN